MPHPMLLAVPNVSEGRSANVVDAIGTAFAHISGPAPGEENDSGARLLDVHSDSDHHRSVFTLAGRQGTLADALLAGARAAVERIDVMHRTGEDIGQHPHVGAVDVMPLVYPDPSLRGAACAEALVVADRLAEELHVPVFLYGELTAEDAGSMRTRADLRRGGVAALARRMDGGEDDLAPAGAAAAPVRLAPDFGPPHLHPTAGATLVCARPPLVAFNLQLTAPATLADAKRIAALVREGGAEGLPGLRAIGVLLAGDVAQVSMNVERPFEVPLAAVVEAVSRHATLAGAELVGLVPARAMEGFPAELPMPGFDPARHTIENTLGWG